MNAHEYKPLKSACPGLSRVVSYSPQLALALGNVNAALLLCQLVYLQHGLKDAKQRDKCAPEGYFFARSGRLLAETGLSYEQQAKARDILARLEIIDQQYQRGSRNLYLRVDLARVAALAEFAIENDLERDEWNGQGATRPRAITKEILDFSIGVLT
jgi:hypothetical protein